MTLELQATPQEVMRAVEALQEFARSRQLTEKEAFGLALALEECASNIVNHGYHGDAGRKFRVTIAHTENSVTVELRDQGAEFDPTRPAVPQPQVNAEDRPPGGWGIELVRHYMDAISYKRENGENVLRLTKRLGQDKPVKSS